MVQLLRMLGKVGQPAVVRQLRRAPPQAGACGGAVKCSKPGMVWADTHAFVQIQGATETSWVGGE